MKEKTCCFTGHRPQSLPWRFREDDPRCVRLKARLRKTVETLVLERGMDCFLSGMAMGIDTYAAELVLELQKRFFPVILECVLPCSEQADHWRQPDRARYLALLERADRVKVIQTRYTADCFQRRNRNMVDRSGLVLAVWDGRPGGTANTVAYARSLGREVLLLDPLSV